MKTFFFFLHLLRTSIRASISQRGAFLLESVLMVGNNLIFISMWWLFFRQFQDINGWNMTDMLVLNAVGIGSYGLSQICFGGAKQIGKAILGGDLDPFMTQPKNLLLHLMGSKSAAKGWGHLMTTAALIYLGGWAEGIPLICLSVFCGCLVFAAIIVIAHSMTFWLGPVESLSRKYCDALFLFVIYPSNIYSGVLQLVMFTVIPAGIIGYLPVELMREFSWWKVVLLVASSLSFFGLAFVVFHQGLKRYESGNQFGMRL